MIYSANTKQKLNNLANNTPQLIIFVGAKGSGKRQIMHELGLKITKSPDILYIEPLEDKKTIGIEQVRQLKKASYLTKPHPEVVIIPQSELLTLEAQNSMLKLLEDTPRGLHIFMAIPTEAKLIETIRSRAYCWRIVDPSEAEIKNYYKDKDQSKLSQAIAISSRKARYLDEYLNGNLNSINIESAKEILSENKFDRLKRVNILAKDKNATIETIEAIMVICETALQIAVKNNNIQKIESWNTRLNECLVAINLLEKSVQAKLVLTKLFLVL